MFYLDALSILGKKVSTALSKWDNFMLIVSLYRACRGWRDKSHSNSALCYYRKDHIEWRPQCYCWNPSNSIKISIYKYLSDELYDIIVFMKCFYWNLLAGLGNYLTLRICTFINNELISILCYWIVNIYEHLISKFNSLLSSKNIGIQRILI